MTFSGTLQLRLNTDLTIVGDLSSGRDQLREQMDATLSNGTGLNEANNIFHDRRTLLTNTNEDLDVAGGLTNPFGATLTFTKIKSISIQAATTNTTNLTVSRPASNGLPFFAAAGDAVVLKPGGVFHLVDASAAGIPVTAGSADLINIANAAGATAEYDIVIVGTT